MREILQDCGCRRISRFEGRDLTSTLRVYRAPPPACRGLEVRFVPTLRINCRQNLALLSSECRDPGSCWEIPAIWHGAGAYHGVLSQKPSTGNGKFRVSVLVLAVSMTQNGAYMAVRGKLWGGSRVSGSRSASLQPPGCQCDAIMFACTQLASCRFRWCV